jgi:hypothetical protein
MNARGFKAPSFTQLPPAAAAASCALSCSQDENEGRRGKNSPDSILIFSLIETTEEYSKHSLLLYLEFILHSSSIAVTCDFFSLKEDAMLRFTVIY